MDIFPAIDLLQGQCVRLAQGDFAAVTFYEPDPLLQVRRFADAGAQWLHIVDLDGAKAGSVQQSDVISNLIAQCPMRVQVGGGIRKAENVETLLNAGVERVVIGSASVHMTEQVMAWMKRFGGDKIVLALDVTLDNGVPEVVIGGWQKKSGLSLYAVIEDYLPHGLQTVLCTDIGRDGMMTGSNTHLYSEIQARFPQLNILASGGVGTLNDIADLRRVGVSGVIVGKALYEQRFTLEQALHEANNAG